MDNYSHLLDESFDLARQKLSHDELGELFFQRFFLLFPETQTFFKGTDIGYFRGKKLQIIFDFLKDVVSHPYYAEGHIATEVIRHQIYGLTDKAYYFGLVDCLMMTIKTLLGANWQPAFEDAWIDLSMAFKAIVGDAIADYV